MGVLIDGPALRRRREDAGLTLGALAAKAGISVSYLSMLESGQRSPSPTVCSALAKALRVAIRDLRPHD